MMLAEVFCDECGRRNVAIHRRYKGHGYCASCYAREFAERRCPSCDGVARLLRSTPDAMCRNCEAGRPCVRCGESGKPVGKITQYGTVCASCAPYFRPEAPCEICGKLSRRLTRVSRFGDSLRRCERCAISDFGTCKACRRYRRLNNSDDLQLCASCHSGEARTCGSCGAQIPSGRGKQCEGCYWRLLLERRTKINCAILKNGPWHEAFVAFSNWLGDSCGSQKAALSLSRHIVFFQNMESHWQCVPSYPEMLERFGVDTLRRYRKVVQWMSESGQIIPDSKLRDSVAEEQRIGRMLERLPSGTQVSLVVNAYTTELRQRSDRGKVQVRTIRLSLTPAIGLLQTSMDQGGGMPAQESVDHYISTHPGQRASLRGFLTFLNNRYQSCLKMPNVIESRAMRRAKAGNRLAELAGCDWEEHTLEEWVIHALEYFHCVTGISRAQARKMERTSDHSGIQLTIDGQEYFIPIPARHKLKNDPI